MQSFFSASLRSIWVWGLGLGLVGCQLAPSPSGLNTPASPAAGDEPLAVTVTIPPQRYFVEKIGGDRVKVDVFVPGSMDPHTYEPKPQQLQALSEADAYVLVGLGFEKGWLDRLKGANPNLVLIDSAQGLKPLMQAEHDHGDHGDHEAHDDHGHESSATEKGPSTDDPHIWLSPPLVKQQAKTIAAELSRLEPARAAEFQANLQRFLTEIDQLDQKIRTTLEPMKPRKFIVFHPSWGYFAQAYQLEQIPIEVAGQEPSAQELGQLVDLAKQKGLRVIFAEPQFSPKSAETIASEIGGKVVTIDPLAADWSRNLGQAAQAIAAPAKLSSTAPASP